MTAELGPSARALLDAARAGLSPDAAAIKRMRAKVDATVASGSAAATITTAKLGLFAVVATIAIGAGVYANRASTPAVPPQIELPSVWSETSAPVVRRVLEPPELVMDAMPVARPHAAAPRVDARPATADAPRGKPIDLAREVELIDQAMTALRADDAAAALRSLRLHAAETRGAGQLAEDAAAIEVEALCRLHDPDVATKLAAFDARFPRSAQRSRVIIACH